MTEKTRKAIGEYISEIDEYVPGLLASDVSAKFNVSYAEALAIIRAPFEKLYNSKPQVSAPCHYCGQPATNLGAFDEPVCKECGG